MGKELYIAEKPSVAQEFAKALKISGSRHDGYIESETAVVTWCVGHLITMSYPESYDPAFKRWSLDTLPFFPKEWKYEVIPAVKKQFDIVSGLLNRKDVDTIYVCTDSGREGEYIYRLVEQMAGVKDKKRLRVWIDSQTEDEIKKGIKTAKDLKDYDNLSASAYLRAKEDYLMGINFSRLLTLKYGNAVAFYLKKNRAVISVGRVMTCVLGMIVRREREIRAFVKTPFYRVLAAFVLTEGGFEAEWRVTEKSRYYQKPCLYKENGFKEKEKAQELIDYLKEKQPVIGEILSIERKKENKFPPLLYNLAELQNDCAKMFKISPDETLKLVQELYEKKLVTYPRTDARVLSTAVAKEIDKNLKGLLNYGYGKDAAKDILQKKSYQGIEKSRYVNDKQITDHYAIIPTGQGLGALGSLSGNILRVFETIVRRFLSIFFPPAVYQKLLIQVGIREEVFFASFKVLLEDGYLKIAGNSFDKKKDNKESEKESNKETQKENKSEKKEDKDIVEDIKCDAAMLQALSKLKKGDRITVSELKIKEGETSPPKRYSSGSIILAMENAGQLIEDEELRAQIKGSGIGTSATRAEILKKLINNTYIALNKKTQVITPTLLGEMVFDVVNVSIRQLLNPELTASWEKGLTYVAEGTISPEEYMQKLESFVGNRTRGVLGIQNQGMLRDCFDAAAQNYKKD